MQKNSTKKLTTAALFTALICVSTFLIKIPAPVSGYIHLGDAFIIISGIVLGPIAFLPASIGSALADVIGGFALYVPATFLIKGLIGFLVGVVWARVSKTTLYTLKCALCGLISMVVMVFGYLIFELFLYGSAAFLNIPLNLVQGFSGMGISVLSLPLVFKIFKIK